MSIALLLDRKAVSRQQSVCKQPFAPTLSALYSTIFAVDLAISEFRKLCFGPVFSKLVSLGWVKACFHLFSSMALLRFHAFPVMTAANIPQLIEVEYDEAVPGNVAHWPVEKPLIVTGEFPLPRLRNACRTAHSITCQGADESIKK